MTMRLGAHFLKSDITELYKMLETVSFPSYPAYFLAIP